ncbi:MAG: ABC-2 transporter permease [Bacilli bacterium]|nr:ABC-2 transporter permease [Bacilli bacterium]MBN2877216.1 ABC-2 transporter permease [Bacilli bacterium]
MKQLMIKEFKLSIHKFFWFIPILTGALLLIPQWVYLIAMMYFFWITIPNVYSTYNSQNDLAFCMLMPIKKEDYVKSKILSVITLELVTMLFGGVFAILNRVLYHNTNFLLDLNLAYFGVVFLMFGLFNLAFYPIYFKTAYRFGKATIVGNVVAILFALGVELLVAFIPSLNQWMKASTSQELTFRVIFLLISFLMFAGFNYIAYKISAKRFERIDL